MVKYGACTGIQKIVFHMKEALRYHPAGLRLLAMLLFLLPLLMPRGASAFSVDDVRIGLHPDKTRIVFELSGKNQFRAFTLENPPRVVIDMPAFEWRAGQISKPAASPVSTIRQGTLEQGRSRIVVELKEPVLIRDAFILRKNEGKPDRLVIDIKQAAGEAAAAQNKVFGLLDASREPGTAASPAATPTPAHIASAAGTAAEILVPARKPALQQPVTRPEPAPAPAKNTTQKIFTIVIDPGHGGVDPGAIGANGVFEKHVSLAVAKELKKTLEATGRYRVLLTRDKDVYLRLRQRVEFARAHNADLFVSLHADSIGKPDVHGASIYTLSEKASDEQTAKLADRENKADIIAGVDISHEDEQVANILIDIAMRDTMNQSRFFANTIMDGMKREKLNILETPHRSAGFAVLKAPDIPSVLVEMGFMSNKTESQMLSNAAYHQKIAESISSGIDAYFRKMRQENRI